LIFFMKTDQATVNRYGSISSIHLNINYIMHRD
jgi:hypothetical protein